MKKRKAGRSLPKLSSFYGLDPESHDAIEVEVGLSFLVARLRGLGGGREIGDIRIRHDGRVFVAVAGVEHEVRNA